MIKDEITIQQALAITKIDEDGIETELEICPLDIVTTVGKERAASHLANSVPAKEWFTHIALGTNDDAESTEDLSLGTEIYRVALDTVFANGQTVFGHSIITANDIGVDSYTLWEVGLLDASAGGNLIARQVFNSSITFTGNEKLEFLWGVIVN